MVVDRPIVKTHLYEYEDREREKEREMKKKILKPAKELETKSGKTSLLHKIRRIRVNNIT